MDERQGSFFCWARCSAETRPDSAGCLEHWLIQPSRSGIEVPSACPARASSSSCRQDNRTHIAFHLLACTTELSSPHGSFPCWVPCLIRYVSTTLTSQGEASYRNGRKWLSPLVSRRAVTRATCGMLPAHSTLPRSAMKFYASFK